MRDLVADLAHELRTPLTSIKGFTETLLEGAMIDAPTCRRFLTIIDDQAARLIRLLDDLTDLSRLASRAAPVAPVPTRLGALVAQAVQQMQPLAARCGIALTSHGPGGCAVLADRDRILQVLLNLIDNAIKFTPEHGSVRVSVAACSAATGAGEAEVSVADTGRGIPADDLPRIFERRYRAARAWDARGAGLGLAIAKRIVDAHGGRLSVASRVGAGTTVAFTLPRAGAPTSMTPRPPVTSPSIRAPAPIRADRAG